MSAGRFTFTVRGPMFEFGIWHANRDVTEYLTGGYTAQATIAEIEELVANFDGNGPVQWDGLTGWYDQSAFDEDDESVTLEYTITLTPVLDVCPECQSVMDSTALAFWAGEDPADFDAESMTCTGCYHFEHFGTRNPTVRQFHDAGWVTE